MILNGIKKGYFYVFCEGETPVWTVTETGSFRGRTIEIQNVEEKKIVAVMKLKTRLLYNAKYVIQVLDKPENLLIIPIKALFSSELIFEYNNKVYCFIEHADLNYSIFENDIQIGRYTKKRIKLFNKEGLSLTVNGDVNIPLILCILSISDLSFKDDDYNIATLDLGNLFVSKKKFDERWVPTR